MTSYLFEPHPRPAAAVLGESAAFPVHRIFCVGRNYAEHAKEMGFQVDREAPFYFLKSATTLVPSGETIPYPPGTDNFHHEMELVFAIGREGFRIDRGHALDHVYGYACGLDMTRRDLQLASREKGRPWDFGKDFERSAVMGPITRAEAFGAPSGRVIELTVNGETRQKANLDDLVWKVDEIVAHLSGYYRLQPGDLIFSGTPAGVGPVVAGDSLRGTIDGLEPVELTIGPAE
ncbi:MAG: fumarylacetoacetate hydrolase family protein [Rhizobiaceae bacterium]|nr:fumarylacetoacetate hydrolase family protein [Rhizobiaceae bacterium]MCV0406029.1 fumarylacetoacetate hydrolase family protein [Rhizobiaceae bacterium]